MLYAHKDTLMLWSKARVPFPRPQEKLLRLNNGNISAFQRSRHSPLLKVRVQPQQAPLGNSPQSRLLI